MSKSNKDEHNEFLAETGYEPSVNQVQDEPLPASHHDDPRQEAVVRNEEHSGMDRGQEGKSGPPARKPDQDGS